MESNRSSFIHHLIGDIFEETFTRKPSDLPWQISKYFYQASIDHHHQNNKHSAPQKAAAKAVSLRPLETPLPDSSPEQPLRDTLLNSAIGIANFFNIKTLLIVSRNGGTVKRLRELTDRFHLTALIVTSRNDSKLSPRQRSLNQLENADLVHIKCDDDDEMEAFDGNLVHHRSYEAAIERIAREGLALALQQAGPDSSGQEVLFCYRSYPRASYVNAFKILTVVN